MHNKRENVYIIRVKLFFLFFWQLYAEKEYNVAKGDITETRYYKKKMSFWHKRRRVVCGSLNRERPFHFSLSFGFASHATEAFCAIMWHRISLALARVHKILLNIRLMHRKLIMHFICSKYPENKKIISQQTFVINVLSFVSSGHVSFSWMAETAEAMKT